MQLRANIRIYLNSLYMGPSKNIVHLICLNIYCFLTKWFGPIPTLSLSQNVGPIIKLISKEKYFIKKKYAKKGKFNVIALGHVQK